MSRDSSGNYTLPAGNPVASGSTISSTVHNNTTTDIATELQDSLSRSGKGSMLVAFKGVDGSVSAPAFSFSSDPDSGIYRIGSNNIGLALNAAKVLDIATTGLSVTGTLSSTGALSVTGGIDATGVLGGSRLELDSTTTLDLSDANAIVVIGPGTGQHIEMDGNDIQSKSDATTAAALNIGRLGDTVAIGAQTGIGQVDLYRDGSLVARSLPTGFAIFDGSGATPTLELRDDSATTLSELFHAESSNALVLRSNVNGDGLWLQARDTGGSTVNTLRTDPDGSVIAYHAGVQALASTSSGAIVYPSSGAGNGILEIEDSDGEDGIVFKGSAGPFYVRNREHGGDVYLDAENTSGVVTTLFYGNPDGDVRIHHPIAGAPALITQTNGILIRDPDGSVPDARWEASDGTDLARVFVSGADFYFRNVQHGGYSYLQAEDSGGTVRSLLRGNPGGATSLYYNGSAKLDTAGAGVDVTGTLDASVGLSVNGVDVALIGHNHTSSDVTDLREVVEDYVGAMVSGNTETGITVVYQDSDGTLDFAVDPFGASTGSMSIDQTAAGDSFLIDDNGTLKSIDIQDMGVRVVEETAAQTFAVGDANTLQLLTGTTARTWTIPTNASVAFNIGATIYVGSRDTATLTLSPAVGVTMTSKNQSDSNDQDVIAGGLAVLIKVATNEWMLAGDIA